MFPIAESWKLMLSKYPNTNITNNRHEELNVSECDHTHHLTLTSSAQEQTKNGARVPFQSNPDHPDTSAVTNYKVGIQKIFLKYFRLHDSNIPTLQNFLV